MSFEAYQQIFQQRIEKYLDSILPKIQTHPEYDVVLCEAIRYSVLNGGKRIRPLLVYATGEALGVPLEQLDAPAAAVELIHCYSLIHDDLPMMDNDDLRRGKPTCHKAFDEAIALLTGDALQTLAFDILSDDTLNAIPAEQQIKMVRVLAKKSGLDGMITGQVKDYYASKHHLKMTVAELESMHHKKTGALIEAAVLLGVYADENNLTSLQSDFKHEVVSKLKEYAQCIGLSFQIQDDILDVIGDTKTLGKTQGTDSKLNKITFPSKLGIERSQEYAKALHLQAINAVDFLAERGRMLCQLSEFFINRVC